MSKPGNSDLERDYCAGVLSLQEVADKHGISIKALRYKAAKSGWIRLKGAKVKKGQKSGAKTKSAPNKNAPKIYDPGDDLSNADGTENEGQISEGENLDLDFDPAEFGLTDREALFAFGCVKTGSRIGGYRFAGYRDTNKNTAYVEASRLYRKPKIARVISELKKRIRKRYIADMDEIVDQLVSITRADANALTQYRRLNCRYCWGERNLYQWRDIDEFDKAAAKAAKDGKSEPEYGGLGFIDIADPNPECTRCHGEGNGNLFISDTRDLDENELSYYLGVKQTKNGIEVITEDKKAARAMLIQLLTSGVIGKPDVIPDAQIDLSHLSFEQLMALRKKQVE